MKNFTGLRQIQWIQKMNCVQHHQSMEKLLGAVFASWEPKGEPYLNEVMQTYLADSGENFPDGGTIWPTRPSAPPNLVDMLASTQGHPLEKHVLELLGAVLRAGNPRKSPT